MGDTPINRAFANDLNEMGVADLEAIAVNVGDTDLQERAKELRTLIGSSDHQAAPTPEQTLVLNIQNAWSEIYGANFALWPESLRDSLETIKKGIGFTNFGANLTSAFQNLRPYEETVPAFEVAVAVVAKLASPNLAEQVLQLQAETRSGFVPESAARAGLSFISNPATLILPIYGGSALGKIAQALIGRAGVVLGLAGEAGGALAEAGGLFAEATGFVATNSVIASVAKQSSEDTFMQEIASVALLPRNDILSEIGSSTIFFGMLRLFGAETRLVASLFPATQTGAAAAKLIGNAGAIGGFAVTEEVQEDMGLAPATSTTPKERLWRAAFLHGALSATRGVIGDITAAENRNADIQLRAREWMDSLRQYVTQGFIPEAELAGAGISRTTGLKMLMSAASEGGGGNPGLLEHIRYSISNILFTFAKENPSVNIIDAIQTLDESKSSFQINGINVTLDIPKDIGIRIPERREFRMGLILAELLKNALKYHDPGKPDRYIKISWDGESFVVEDNGRGFKDPSMAYQLDYREYPDAAKGSGYGLYGIRSYIGKWGWDIKLESEAGKFTRFTITPKEYVETPVEYPHPNVVRPEDWTHLTADAADLNMSIGNALSLYKNPVTNDISDLKSSDLPLTRTVFKMILGYSERATGKARGDIVVAIPGWGKSEIEALNWLELGVKVVAIDTPENERWFKYAPYKDPMIGEAIASGNLIVRMKGEATPKPDIVVWTRPGPPPAAGDTRTMEERVIPPTTYDDLASYASEGAVVLIDTEFNEYIYGFEADQSFQAIVPPTDTYPDSFVLPSRTARVRDVYKFAVYQRVSQEMRDRVASCQEAPDDSPPVTEIVESAPSAEIGGEAVDPGPPVRRWFVNLYRMLEGDTARFMLANEAFKDIPPEYRPGNLIEVIGVKIPKNYEIADVWKSENMPEGLEPVITAEGDNIFWLHPLAVEKPPDMPSERKIHHAGDQRTIEASHKDITRLLKLYPQVRGKAVVSSSVRTVLLYQVDDKPLETPYELKLHLPYFIMDINRSLTGGDIEKVWRQQNSGDIPSVPLLFGSSIRGSYTFQPEYDSCTPPKRAAEIGYSFSDLVRDAGFRIEGDRVHFQIPFFALFGGAGIGGQDLLARFYDSAAQVRPDLTPHDFVIDQLIAPFVVPTLDMMNNHGVIEGGFHYQNPVLKMSVPVNALSERDPLSWVNGPDISIEGVVTKEVSGYRLSTHHHMAYVDALVTNLWSHFATESNWAGSFENFDRGAFRVRMAGLLRDNAPSTVAPEGIEQDLWDQYVAQYANILNGVTSPAVALANEVMQQPGGRRMGGSLSFVHGSMVFATAPSGLNFDSERTFVPMFDKIAYLTFANPEADIHELVEHENGLYEAARQKAAEQCVTQESNPVSFLQEVLNEAYSDPEVERLKAATANHAGLSGLTEEGRAWLADVLFNTESGLFTKQLRAFKELKPKKQAKVDLEHLPRLTYWFTPIVERLLNARWSGEIATPAGRESVEKDITKLAAGLKTYDRGPFLKWLMERFF